MVCFIITSVMVLREAALDIRNATTAEDIARAVAMDAALVGSRARADYIASVADTGGLSLAMLHGRTVAFSCLDQGYFFGKPFISLLVVAPEARRQGVGMALLSHHAATFDEAWTSTNRSNSAMRELLGKAGWTYCGELIGLDEGDPEQFYKSG